MSADRSSEVLDYTVRQLLERGARLIVKESTEGPAFDRRLDWEFDLEFYDRKIARHHRVRCKLRLTARSLIFDGQAADPAQPGPF